jgi:acetylglutamate/LysW-gamma-L-alpha-aminoadipate kinase
VLLTDVEGLYLNERLIDELYVSEAKRIVNDIGPGMITKVYASIEAIEGGVKEVVIASGLKDEAITSAIENKSGTLIKR